MSMTPEKAVKVKVVAILKEFGAWYCYPVASGFGSSGIPDILVCYKGRFIAVECKANGGKPTALQQKNLEQITTAGGLSMVLDETNYMSLRTYLGALT